MTRFSEIMDTVLKWEGGFVDNPHDKGGPTNMGITHTVLAKWRGVGGVTRTEVKNLTKNEAIEIYQERYWKRIRGPSLTEPIDLIVMDGAVNHGVSAMSRKLQASLGVELDGRIGKQTVEALVNATNTEQQLLDLAVQLAERRKYRYVNHESAPFFLNGWRNRLNDVMATALKDRPVSWTFKDGKISQAEVERIEPEPVSTFVRPIIEDSDLQAMLATAGLYQGDIDGLFGPKSTSALNKYLSAKSSEISGHWQNWSLQRRKIALGQLLCIELGIETGRVDGLVGPLTIAAFEGFNRKKLGLPPDQWRDEIDASPVTGHVSTSTAWPREADVPSFFGTLGADCVLVPLKRLTLPYKMRLAWDTGTEIGGIRLHEKVYDSAGKIFDRLYSHYKDDGVEELGLNMFGGTTSCRRKKNGTSWSMHAWSIAIDFDPSRNQLNWNHTKARLAKPDAVKFWEFWEAEGWVSLGRAKDFDWMHVQAARL